MIKELKAILKAEGLTGKDLAELLGTEYSTYRSMTRKNREGYPKWVKAFVIGYKLGQSHGREETTNDR